MYNLSAIALMKAITTRVKFLSSLIFDMSQNILSDCLLLHESTLISDIIIYSFDHIVFTNPFC